jgi:hypothetical protein
MPKQNIINKVNEYLYKLIVWYMFLKNDSNIIMIMDAVINRYK